jgi:DNA (cytosine-5)-methyltransferase 1
MRQTDLKFIDLFAGIGGIKTGFMRAGFDCVYSNDIDPYCKQTFDSNFDVKLDISGIKAINIQKLPDYNILVGGFPCQAFSIAGYRKGFNDSGRGDLFFDIHNLLIQRPVDAFLLENVKNLMSHDNGKTIKIIEQHLIDAGYNIAYKVLNTMDYANIPQNRERIYIVGFKNKNAFNRFEFPQKKLLLKTLLDVLESHKVDDKYYYNDKPLFEKISPFIDKTNTAYQWRRKYVRENKSGVCPTLTANMGTGGHNVPIIKDNFGIRKLTPRECSRLQGFNDNYIFPNISDSHLYKQIGNSVSIPVIELIANGIKQAL